MSFNWHSKFKIACCRPSAAQMIDDEVNFGNIFDASEEVQVTAKFGPKQRPKTRKTALSSRSAAPNPTEETGDRKVGTFSQVNSSKELTSQERTSLMCPSTESVDIIAGSHSILDTPLEDALTVPQGSLSGASAADRTSQYGEHNDDPSKLATHQENLVVSDINVPPNSSCSKAIDDIVEFGDMCDVQIEEERVTKFQPKVQTKLLKEIAKSRKTNQKVETSTVDVVTQNGKGNNIQTRLHGDPVQDPKSHESVQIPDSEGLLATDNSKGCNLANLNNLLEESVQEETIAKFRSDLQPNLGKASSQVAAIKINVVAVAPIVGVCDSNNDMYKEPKDQETITGPVAWSPQAVHADVDLDNHNEPINPPIDGTQSMFGEVPGTAFTGREKGKSKSVSFALSDVSGIASPIDTNSEMGNIGDSCSDKLTDENLSNSSRHIAEKHSITKDQYSNEQDHEREPLDHAVQQQPKSDVGERASSMKRRCRKKVQKVGTPNHTVDDYFGEDCVEPSLAEEDNDTGDHYTTGNKHKARKKSRGGVEESQQQKAQKNKSKVSSRGRKRTLKDESTEKPEKKLTHRIRQRIPKEVKALLETPREQIKPMKLCASHLRLLQEARERVDPKGIPSGPSSNTRNFQLDDMDDLGYRDEEARFFDNDITEEHVQNATKLNYHSYMNKPARGKWSKSDTDLFYEGLRQFGIDFAMIQQLFPDKTRHQVRQKFKSEERKNPLLVHDAIVHRSGDNLYFKKVIKQLNIEDVVLPDIKSTQKQDGASSERGPGNENVLDDLNEEENSSNWLNEEHDVQMADVEEEHGEQMDDVEEERDLGNDGGDDDLGDVFDWY
ncbi:Homeodomain-like superfamily protein [Zea mays]|uniref:Homeodomain-like superfamily protein n=1 Tax=Zea mays TaxID=4577 RepID=A0A1D6HF58_MAIZE|nr:Homeodomain-like superfamily protein [Zea mays]AQK73282.1 Homeodomain-like superfamily protein [Zea mays]AQK73301.1 Homeodomain-like superfamily protein [Zea mays]AQK73306.1 Homeodomain-like superfamily protein [Zea mays]|eukprot:XP_020394219.1 transcription factor TFIIIB component B'' homolog isoform X3 [Zea mays]